MKHLSLTAAAFALTAVHLVIAVAQDNGENPCGASVAMSDVRQNADNGDWYFVFDIVEGNSPQTVSSGQFYYTVHYVDSSNVPHDEKFQGDSWAAGEGHHFSLTIHRSIPEAVSVQNVEVSDVSSGGCSP